MVVVVVVQTIHKKVSLKSRTFYIYNIYLFRIKKRNSVNRCVFVIPVDHNDSKVCVAHKKAPFPHKNERTFDYFEQCHQAKSYLL